MGIRIDALDAALAATRDHVLPAMKDNVTVQLTVGQILDVLVDSAPGALDTLNELAAALGDDANFAATVTNALALKAALLSAGTSDNTFSDSDELAYVSGTTQKRGTVTGLKENIVASILLWTAKQTFQNAEFTTNPLDLPAGRIKFPATQVASADANTLDDYEEGAWTPTITQGATPSTSTKVGTYTKIGRLVTLNMLAIFSGAGTAANAIDVTGLPFTPAAASPTTPGVAYFFDSGSQFYVMAADIQSGGSLRFVSNGATNSFGISPAITIANGDRLSFTISYEV